MEDDTTTMAKEDHRNCDGGGGGGIGRSSKKEKVKKMPQRGLGVAQLEKLIEEQQKRDVPSILQSPSSSLSSTKTSHMSLPNKNFHNSNQHYSTIPLPCGPPAGLRSPLSLQQQQPHMNSCVSNTVPLANSGAFEVPGHRNVPKWWSSYEFDIEKDKFGVDPGLPFPPSLPFESNPISPLPNWVQRTPQSPQFQHQSSSSVVNVSSTPVSQFFIEPPSNQNYSGSSVPVRPVEKMVGMKRPYPFSLNFPQAPAFNYKFPPFADTRTNAKASCSNGSEYNFDAGYSNFREVPSCSASNSEPNSKKRNKENENFKGDFLTLAPPSSPTSCPPSKFKSSPTFLAFHNQEYAGFPSLSFQGNIEDQIPTLPVYRQFNQQKQPFYRFFLPEAKEEQIGQATARIQNGHEVGESVDLSLKL